LPRPLLLPSRLISCIVGKLAHIESPALIPKLFISLYRSLLFIGGSRETSYRSLAEYFARPFPEGSRPLQGDIVSPCDGQLYLNESIDSAQTLRVKACQGTLAELVGQEVSATDTGFRMLGIYLSPRDYHRVFCPLDAELLSIRHIPGRLLSVGPIMRMIAPRLYLENERLVFELSSKGKKVYLTMVGALNVGQMKVTGADFSKNELSEDKRGGTEASFQTYKSKTLRAGQELAYFSLGSTVLLAFENGMGEVFSPLGKLKMGQSIVKSRTS